MRKCFALWMTWLTSMLVTFSLLAATESEKVLSVSQKEEVKALQNKIEQEKLEERETREKALQLAKEIKKTIERVNQAEASMAGMSGLGYIEQLKVKAERYGLERQVRKQIEKDFFKLHDMLNKCQRIKKRIAEDEKMLKLKKTLLMYENTVKETSPIEGLDLTDFEYYEVKSPATLREISSLPDVYGDASLWKYIYEANKEKISDPEGRIPKGTVLVVPNIKPEFELDFQNDEAGNDKGS